MTIQLKYILSNEIMIKVILYKYIKRINKYPQFVSNTGPGRGMRFNEAILLKVWIAMMLANHACHTITGADEMKWNEWEVWWNSGIKFVAGEIGRNPKKNLPKLYFVHHKTHIEWQRCELRNPEVGGKRPWSRPHKRISVIIRFTRLFWRCD